MKGCCDRQARAKEAEVDVAKASVRTFFSEDQNVNMKASVVASAPETPTTYLCISVLQASLRDAHAPSAEPTCNVSSANNRSPMRTCRQLPGCTRMSHRKPSMVAAAPEKL